jgi:hypothetical protein
MGGLARKVELSPLLIVLISNNRLGILEAGEELQKDSVGDKQNVHQHQKKPFFS